jgi:hypothetical protein
VTNLGLLLLRFLLLLLGLRLGDGGLTGSCAVRGGLVAAGGNGGEIGTNDTTLVLHGTAGTLLGDLLRDALLVHATVDLRPGDLTRVLALEEEGGILRRGEAEDLSSIAIVRDKLMC